jgi:membrane protein YqaA with SNARE-associated domain
VGDVLALAGIAVLSALVPLVNIEAYLIGLGAVTAVGNVWLLSGVAAVGQMAGKLVWYYLGANALRWGWVRRRVETPKAQARLELWRSRTHENEWLAGGLTLVSAFSGFPPFAIVAVLAGQLRMSLLLFLVTGTVGRWLRFAAFLGGADWLSQLLF